MLRALVKSTFVFYRPAYLRNVITEARTCTKSYAPSTWLLRPHIRLSATTPSNKPKDDKQKLLTSLSGEIRNVGLRRYIDVIRKSAVLMDDSEKMGRYDLLWKLILSDENRNIDLANKYLMARLDCGLSFDSAVVLNDLQQAGLWPNVQTYGIFIHQSCQNENMDEVSTHLQALQNANLRPNGYIFSQILYGYLKAGCPEEVSATQEIMSNLGLWPSRIAYDGLLNGYAELGDRTALLSTLNEAWDVLTQSKGSNTQRSELAPFFAPFLIRIYVKLMNAEPATAPVCTELLARLPVSLDSIGRARAREGVKTLLASGRVDAAVELFRRSDPESADDSYLVSLARYISHSGLDPQGVSVFWKMAEASGSRLNMLKWRTSLALRRQTASSSEFVDKIQEAYNARNVDGIFDVVKSNGSDSLSSIYNVAVPKLLLLGCSVDTILERIKPKDECSAAALGCVLGMSVPFDKSGQKPQADLNAVEKLAVDLEKRGLLPYEGFVSVSTRFAHQVLNGVVSAKGSESRVEKLCKFFDTLSHALNQNQLRSVIIQMFVANFEALREINKSDVTEQDVRNKESQIMLDLVDACLAKDIKFSRRSWIFYNLEAANVPQDKRERLEAPFYPSKVDKTRPPSIWRTLYDILQKGDIDGAIEVIQKESKNMSITERRVSLPDPVLIASSVNSDKASKGANSPAISAQDIEKVFWASWDARLLLSYRRAVSQVASAYINAKDIKGLASFVRRTSSQSELLQECVLSEANMRALLHDNFQENFDLLQKVIQNPYLPISTFASAAFTLEDVLINQFPDQMKNQSAWERGSPDYWPVQVLAKRLENVNHLSKLRLLGHAIDDLCHSNMLYAAHSLRQWSSQLNVFLLPKSNELLVLTPYMMGYREHSYPLPRLFLSHDLSQHRPVNLTEKLLSSFDSLVLADHSKSDGESDQKTSSIDAAANTTANWLVKNILAYSPGDSVKNPGYYLPTWLVICQRLTQAGSMFVSPASWSKLASAWLTQIGGARDALTQMTDWIQYAPTNQHKAALLLSCLAYPKTTDWALTNLLKYPDLSRLLALSNPLECVAVEDKQRVTRALSALKKSTLAEISDALAGEQSDLGKFKAVISSLPEENWIPQLAELVSVKEQLLAKVPSYLEGLRQESVVNFYDELFNQLRSDRRRIKFLKSCIDCMISQGVDVKKLSAANQALVNVITHIVRKPDSGVLGSLTPLKDLYSADLTHQWISEVDTVMACQDYGSLVNLIEKLKPETLKKGLQLVIYELSMPSRSDRLPGLLLAIAERQNGDLLRQATTTALPFIPPGLGQAYMALSKEYSGGTLSWFDRACIRYQKLGPMIPIRASQPSVTGDREARSENKELAPPSRVSKPGDELMALLRQSISSVADAIIRAQSNPGELNEQLAKISTDWSPNRRCSLLSHLAAAGATSAVDSVISLSPAAVRESQELYKISSVIIQEGKNQMENGESQVLASPAVESAVDKLSALGTVDKAYLKGPHVESLFRYWPDKRLKELVDLVIKTNQSEQTSVVLQLAAVLVNRGRLDLADPLIQSAGPIPITFLAGSPRHTLSVKDFETTLAYLRQKNSGNISVFVDTCLRNCVSAPPPFRNNVVNLVRKITSEPLSMDLSSICHLPTVHLIADFVGRNPKLPNDVKKLLEAVVDGHSAHKQAAAGGRG